MALTTSGRCQNCGGIVRNVSGKRYTVPNLTEIHNRTCPGLLRSKTSK